MGLWAWLRGVGDKDRFKICRRCGFSGLIHLTGFYPCIRFAKEKDEKRTSKN